MLNEYLHDAAWFEDALFDAGDAILKGYSMQEIEWGWLGKNARAGGAASSRSGAVLREPRQSERITPA